MKTRLLSFLTCLMSVGLGVFALLYPFFLPTLVQGAALASIRTQEMPLMLTFLLGLSLLVILFEMQGRAMSAKLIALLGILVAINSTLRFIEVTIPGPGGFTPVFFLIILTGYVYGSGFGFLMGALTLLVSALITGGVGPWLPGQMLTAGWMGMSAAVCQPIARRLGIQGKIAEIILLSGFGAFWGLLYGAIMNIWSWPFIAGPSNQSWAPGIGFKETLARYGLYYLITSLVWDLGASAGNVLLISLFGTPTLRVLRRFRQRFTFRYLPSTDSDKQGGSLDR